MTSHTDRYWAIGIAGTLTVATLLWLRQKKPKYGFGPMMRPHPTAIHRHPQLRMNTPSVNTIYSAHKGTTGVKGPQNTDPWDLGPNVGPNRFGPIKEKISRAYQYGSFCGCIR